MGKIEQHQLLLAHPAQSLGMDLKYQASHLATMPCSVKCSQNFKREGIKLTKRRMLWKPQRVHYCHLLHQNPKTHIQQMLAGRHPLLSEDGPLQQTTDQEENQETVGLPHQIMVQREECLWITPITDRFQLT